MYQREVNALVAALTATPEFKRLTTIRRQLLSDPKLGPQMRQFESERKRSEGSSDPKRSLEQLAARSQNLFKTPKVAEFMSAFTAFNKVVNQAMQTLYKSIDGHM